MAVLDIVTLDSQKASVLRQKARKVHRVDDYIRQLIAEMIETVHAAHGAGLAAPQVGVPLRVIVTFVDEELRVVVNPEIVDLSGDEVEGEEGCLSIPGWWGPVTRRERVTVRGLSRTGKPIKIKTEGWEARVFQHEVDHLDGVLFVDRMDDRRRLRRVESEQQEEDLEEEQVIA